MIPTSVLLRLELPSSPALVARLSRASQGWACTTFRRNQVVSAFPPIRRFLIARLRPDSVWLGHGLKTGGYSTVVGLVPVLALAPDVLVSQHPAPTSRFPRLGEPRAWGLATPGSIALRMKTSGCGRVGGPPMHSMLVHWWAAGSTRERCRTLFTFLVQVNGYARQLRITRRATPPSFDVVATDGYDAVASMT